MITRIHFTKSFSWLGYMNSSTPRNCVSMMVEVQKFFSAHDDGNPRLPFQSLAADPFKSNLMTL